MASSLTRLRSLVVAAALRLPAGPLAMALQLIPEVLQASIATATGTNLGTVSAVSALTGDNGTAERGNVAKPFATVQAAVAASLNGDTLLICPGTYAEAVVIPDALTVTLKGTNRATTTIAGGEGQALTWEAAEGADASVTLLDLNFTSTAGPTLIATNSDDQGLLRMERCSINNDGARGAIIAGVGVFEVFDIDGFNGTANPLLDLSDTTDAILFNVRLSRVRIGGVSSVTLSGSSSLQVLDHTGAANVTVDRSVYVRQYAGASLTTGNLYFHGEVGVGGGSINLTSASQQIDFRGATLAGMGVSYSGAAPLSVDMRGADVGLLGASRSGAGSLNIDLRGGSAGQRNITAGCTLDRDGDAIEAVSVAAGVTVFVFGAGALAAVPPWPAGVGVVAVAQGVVAPTSLGDLITPTASGPAGFSLETGVGSGPKTARVILHRVG